MKPILLKMTAFGSFAEPTAIEFDKLKSGLFLVTGDTGAGKTTIFDAIVFALYGEMSGEERKAKKMHSDYVDKSQDGIVEFTFEQNGIVYNITRKIHFTKKQGTKDEYSNDAIIQGSIICPNPSDPDKPETCNNPTEVTKKVETIIGLNESQFRQIVMLAQGEFKKFLKSNSEDKSKILNKLFDNSVYQYYQNLITAAAAELRKERGSCEDMIDTVMTHTFIKPEVAEGDGETVLWIKENPALLENLSALLDTEKNNLNELEKRKEKSREEHNRLRTEFGTATEKNKDVDDLEKAREYVATLEKQKDEFADLKKRTDSVSNAVHFAIPAIRFRDNEKKRVEDLKNTIEELEKNYRETELRLNELKGIVEADQENNQKIEEYGRQIQSLEDSKADYDKAAGVLADIERRKSILVQNNQEKIKTQNEIVSLEEAIQKYNEEKESLKDSAVKLEQLKTAFQDVIALEEELSGKKGLKAAVEDIRKETENLEKEQILLNNLAEKAKDSQNEYNRLYNLFIDGQAGILAEKLKKTIEEDGQADCPVCHTHFVKGSELHLSEAKEGVPGQSEVDEAKALFEAEENRRREQDNKCIGLKSGIEQKKKQLTDRAEKIFKETVSFETLDGTSWLEERIEANTAKKKELENQKAAAEENVRRYDFITKQLETDQPKLNGFKESLSGIDKVISSGKEELETREKEYAECRASLKFANKQEVEKQINDLQVKKKELSDKVTENRENKEKCETEFASVSGSLATNRANLPKAEEECLKAEENLSQTLKKYGFASEEEAKGTIVNIANPEQWIWEQENDFKNYENSLSVTKSRIVELEKKTEGYAKVNLDELKAKIDSANDAMVNDEKEYNKVHQLLLNHQEVYDKVHAEKEKLADTDKAWSILSELSEIAGGDSTEGGKISFERYVMGATFREIIDKANMRLDRLSGGQYELVHELGGDRKNGVAGLNIDVLDHDTGIQRGSESLSGGESFTVSLALALGLSDEVRSRAGGCSLDTMFIDEGFGTLDVDILDKAVQVLESLSDDKNHLVGIISHVSRLEESIPQKIVVTNGKKGSSVKMEGIESA